MELVDGGHSSEILFTVQRNDVKGFSAAKDIDPEYARLLEEAKKRGVFVTPLACKLSEKETTLLNKSI
jgi:sugar fermentation stimulation protein A